MSEQTSVGHTIYNILPTMEVEGRTGPGYALVLESWR